MRARAGRADAAARSQVNKGNLRKESRAPRTQTIGRRPSAFDPKAPETNQGLERDLLKLIREYRLPVPQINVQVGPCIVDFLWPGHNLIVEADSYEFHRDRATFESDRKRDIQLRLAGYTVIRLTHRRLREEPAVVANELRALLSAS